MPDCRACLPGLFAHHAQVKNLSIRFVIIKTLYPNKDEFNRLFLVWVGFIPIDLWSNKHSCEKKKLQWKMFGPSLVLCMSFSVWTNYSLAISSVNSGKILIRSI